MAKFKFSIGIAVQTLVLSSARKLVLRLLRKIPSFLFLVSLCFSQISFGKDFCLLNSGDRMPALRADQAFLLAETLKELSSKPLKKERVRLGPGQQAEYCLVNDYVPSILPEFSVSTSATPHDSVENKEQIIGRNLDFTTIKGREDFEDLWRIYFEAGLTMSARRFCLANLCGNDRCQGLVSYTVVSRPGSFAIDPSANWFDYEEMWDSQNTVPFSFEREEEVYRDYFFTQVVCRDHELEIVEEDGFTFLEETISDQARHKETFVSDIINKPAWIHWSEDVCEEENSVTDRGNTQFDRKSSELKATAEAQKPAQKPPLPAEALEDASTSSRKATSSASKGVVERLVQKTAKVATQAYTLVTQAGPKFAADAGLAIYEEFTTNRNPFDVTSYHPLSYMGVVAQVALKKGAETVGELSGTITPDQDLGKVVGRAEEHLKRGKLVFSQSQQAIARGWIDEAKTKLAEFTKERTAALSQLSKELGTSAKVDLPTDTGEEEEKVDEEPVGTSTSGPHSAKGDKKNLPKKERPSKGSKGKTSQEPTAPPEPPKVTLNALVTKAKTAVSASVPTKEVLEKENKPLLHLLMALDAFTKLPNEIQQTTAERVRENIRKNPAMGSGELLSDLQTRAMKIAHNARVKPAEQSKPVLIAVSGPGTGKTTGIQKMTQWAEVPICMLPAEKFQKLQVTEKQTAFDLFTGWVQECITTEFRVGNHKVVNGLFLLDDWHFVLDSPHGLLSERKDPESRKKFWAFLKNIGDGNQEDIIEVELAPGRRFPLNLGRAQLAMTLNELPTELKPSRMSSNDSPLISRVAEIKATYPSELDRQQIALTYVDKIVEQIRDSLSEEFKDQVNNLDLELCKAQLLRIAQEEYTYIKERYGANVGMRGFIDLFNQYQGHVMNKADPEFIDPKLCSFEGKAGIADFDPFKVMDSILDYKKPVSVDLADIELMNKLRIAGANLKVSVEKFEPLDRAEVLKHLKTAESNTRTTKAREKAFDEAVARAKLVVQKVIIPDKETIGSRLMAAFGYLKTSQESSRSGSRDVDRFSPLLSTLESIHVRLKSSEGAFSLNPGANKTQLNKIIQVNYTDESAYDLSFFEQLAEAFGGVPVCHLISKDHVSGDMGKDRIGLASSDSLGLELNKNHVGASYEVASIRETTYLRQMSYDNLRFFYVPIGNDNYFLPRSVLAAISNRTFGSVITDQALASFYRLPQEALTDGSSPLGRVSLINPPKVWDECLKQVHGLPSSTQSFVIIHLTADVLGGINEWAKVRAHIKTESSLKTFLGQLSEDLNSGSVSTKYGQFDLHKMTVFVVASGDIDYEQEVVSGTEIISFGRPPISGRKVRAEALLKQKIDELKTEFAARGLSTHELEKYTISAEEAAWLDDFIQSDREDAEKAETYGVNLPMSPLDETIKLLIDRVRQRNNYFNLTISLASYDDLRAARNEKYKPYLREVERIIERRAAEEKRRLLELEEAQKKKIEDAERREAEARALQEKQLREEQIRAAKEKKKESKKKARASEVKEDKLEKKDKAEFISPSRKAEKPTPTEQSPRHQAQNEKTKAKAKVKEKAKKEPVSDEDELDSSDLEQEEELLGTIDTSSSESESESES